MTVMVLASAPCVVIIGAYADAAAFSPRCSEAPAE